MILETIKTQNKFHKNTFDSSFSKDLLDFFKIELFSCSYFEFLHKDRTLSLGKLLNHLGVNNSKQMGMNGKQAVIHCDQGHMICQRIINI